MADAVRFAILGVGVPNQNLGGHEVYHGIGAVHAKFLAETPSAELVACCDRNTDTGPRFAAAHGIDFHADYAELLARDDIDAVAICTPSGMHGEHAVAAVRAGKMVVVEKPLEITVARIDALLAEVKAAGVRAAVVFPMRYYRGVNAVRDALLAGRFGTPALLNGLCRRYRDDVYYRGWRGTWQFDGGGACMNQGIHLIDTMLFLMDDLETVQARVATLGHDRSQCEVEDTAVAVLTFRRGTIGMIQCTTCAYNDFGDRIELHAMRGSAVLQGSGVAHWEMRDEPEFAFDPADYTERKEEFTGHRLLYAELVPHFRDGAPCRCSLETGRRSVALIEAIYESARNGGSVVRPVL